VGATFTLEGWFNLSALGTSQGLFYIGDRTSNNGRIQCLVNANGSINFVNINNAGTTTVSAVSATGVFTFGTWNHVAFIRSSADALAYIYLNGNLVASAVPSGTVELAINRVDIGLVRLSNTLFYSQGYYSNLRIVKSLVVYTGAFNVPKAPLLGVQPAGPTNISAISGTQTALLLNTPNNANFLADSSANQFTMTNTGSATAAALTPFVNGGGSGWAFAGPENGSASFNGTNQYLSAAANAAFAFATGDFTVEAWVNSSVVFTGGILPIAQSDAVGSSTNNKWWFGLAGTGLFFGTHASGGFSVTTTTAFSAGTWYHVAVTRAGGVMKMFINGVSTAFATSGNPSGYNLSQNGLTVGAIRWSSFSK
jgi:hypothetical protein